MKYLGVVKTHHAVYVIKDLLGDDSAALSQNEAKVLDRLSIAVKNWVRYYSRHMKEHWKKKKQIWKVLGGMKQFEISHAFNRPD